MMPGHDVFHQRQTFGYPSVRFKVANLFVQGSASTDIGEQNSQRLCDWAHYRIPLKRNVL